MSQTGLFIQYASSATDTVTDSVQSNFEEKRTSPSLYYGRYSIHLLGLIVREDLYITIVYVDS